MDPNELKGRKKIYTDEKNITYKNVISVLSEALIEHSTNASQIKYLLDYEKGVQPIYSREKEIRPEINIKVGENNAAKITDFKVSYEFGNPITYVQRGGANNSEKEADKDDVRISALNEMLFEESKQSKDVELARYIKICGVGYRMIKAKPKVDSKSVFDVITLNPITTFVIYSNDIYQKPVMAVTYSIQKNGNTLYGCYTEDTYFEIDNGVRIINGAKDKEKWLVTNGQGVANIPSIIPIIEYINDYDRMGCFEKVMSVLNAINTVNSDRVNDIAQNVQSILWLNNCEVEQKVRNGEVIQTKSPDGRQANIQFLQNPLNQTEIQTLADSLHRQAMEIAGVPQRQENSGGGSTGSAMNLSSGWQFAETMAQRTESIFEQSERQAIKVMLWIINKSIDIPEDIKDIIDLTLSEVSIKFSRNKIYDIATKVNALSTLINTGIDGKHAIEIISLFTDPQAVWNESKELIQSIQKNQEKKTETDTKKVMTDMSDQPQKSAFSNIL